MIGKILLVSGAAYLGAISFNFVAKKSQAWNRAQALAGDKGIINLGCGGNGRYESEFSRIVRESPLVVVNCDISTVGAALGDVQVIDLEDLLPFREKEFDVAFASHTLEHLENWEQALDEWSRIADHVIIVLPSPLAPDFLFHFSSEHKQHFSFNDHDLIRTRWPTVEVFT